MGEGKKGASLAATPVAGEASRGPTTMGMEVQANMQGGATRRTVIIAMTAHLLPEDAEECRHAGMDDLIPQPIEFDRLLGLIKKYR